MHHMDKKFLAWFYRLNNIKISKYFNYELSFNDIFSKDNWPRTKGGAYVLNIDDKQN